MRVTERQWDRPFDLRLLADLLKAVPADIVGGVADAKYRVQQQLHRARAGSNDQVCAADGAGKTAASLGANPLNGQQQGDAQGDGNDGEQRGKPAVGQTLDGKAQQIHQNVSGWLARFNSASDRARSKRVARLVS